MATETKPKAKAGKQKSEPKKKVGGSSKNNKEKVRKAREVIEDLQGIEPIRLNVPKPKNFGERAVIARDLAVSGQTIYNWERAFKVALPSYFAGLSLLPKKGEGKKEYPNLTPYQQFCLRQLNSLRKSLDHTNCEANSDLVANNAELFTVEFFEQEEKRKVSVISSETIE